MTEPIGTVPVELELRRARRFPRLGPQPLARFTAHIPIDLGPELESDTISVEARPYQGIAAALRAAADDFDAQAAADECGTPPGAVICGTPPPA